MLSFAFLHLRLLFGISDSEEIQLGPAEGTDGWSSNVSLNGALHVRIQERPIRKRHSQSPPEPNYNPVTGFRAVATQWRSDSPVSSCLLEGYEFFNFLESADDENHRVTLSSRLGKKLDKLEGLNSGHWARTVRKLRLEGDPRLGPVEAVITCETHVDKAAALPFYGELFLGSSLHHSRFAKLPSPLPPTEKFMAELRELEKTYRPLRQDHNLTQIFLLQVHHANLNQFSMFLEVFATEYTVRRMRMFDPRRAELRQWTLEAIMADSHLYRQFSNVGKEMVQTIESLLGVVSALGCEGDTTDLNLLVAEVRGGCKDVTARLERMSDDLDHRLKLLDLARDMRQSKNVGILTLLATIFLPLSLSAGVLSMQTRFKDLGVLIYDFFGVVILLLTAVMLLLAVIFVLSFTSEVMSMFSRYEWYRKFGRILLLVTVTIVALIFGALILTSFLVGLFKDVVLGAKILGYGTAVGIFAPIVIPIFIICTKITISWILDRMASIRWEIRNMLQSLRYRIRNLLHVNSRRHDPENNNR